ncbi:hypothetical protein J5N97_013797 [Dioscorea zingiberensis]|uniref:Uncharacterized protein n=1 Tax=Dioscorea zingiberensis TaxID=325984 RepID=A0A9D5CTX6_9LILI|nr:hypothetical protein J5N97_013797 [Dioscorea zingiberensis]
MTLAGLILLNIVLSFMWVWAGSLSKLLIYNYLGVRHYPAADVLKIVFGINYMFFFTWLTVLIVAPPSTPSPCSHLPFPPRSKASSSLPLPTSLLRYLDLFLELCYLEEYSLKLIFDNA